MQHFNDAAYKKVLTISRNLRFDYLIHKVIHRLWSYQNCLFKRQFAPNLGDDRVKHSQKHWDL